MDENLGSMAGEQKLCPIYFAPADKFEATNIIYIPFSSYTSHYHTFQQNTVAAGSSFSEGLTWQWQAEH
ncbi:MAG: hypothetical protein ISR50_20405 [Alphaproteobacteria bacterium]|nr:hypothetical protein [Alphaproteobacteria bacterium]